ncbi:MAG TPA: hypothetical protein VKF38_06410 [Anaerolineaceae bacterium]|nr:hypothetical protein [Anaerolineaceae bacterium]
MNDAISAGAKGIGECSLAPAAPAVVNAISNAISVEFNDLPVRPEKILPALKRNVPELEGAPLQ